MEPDARPANRLSSVARKRTAQLTHYGRRTGNPHTVTIWFTVDGETVYLQTMDTRRQWTRNVRVNPTISLRIGDEIFAGEATPVTDSGEMEQVARLLKKKYWLARPYLWLKKKPDGAFRVRLLPRR